MKTDKKFNLIDEQWIPIQGRGLFSLRDIFSEPSLRRVGGNPIQKTAIFKLLCAIAQAAWTPKTEEEWRQSTVEDFCRKCLTYLEKWHEKFWLYGDEPFLQFPEVKDVKVASFAALNLEKASGNTTVLTQIQLQSELSEADKAVLLVTLMGFATGGKKVDNSKILTPGYKGKSKSGKAGSSLGFKGYLHSYVQTSSVASTLWLNLFSEESLSKLPCYPEGVGTAPWEKMPAGEDCDVARKLKDSLMGRLVPLCRFCLLSDAGMHYTEGIAHDGYQAGRFDPTQSVARQKNDFKTLWADPDKKPWRSLTSILSFLGIQDASRFVCSQVEMGMSRARDFFESVELWSGGVRVTSNAGEQYLTGSDDFVESQFEFSPQDVGEQFFVNFSASVDQLDHLAKQLYSSVLGYFETMGTEGKTMAERATSKFWEIAGLHAQELIDSCFPGENPESVRNFFRATMRNTYNESCPHFTPRQLQAWAENQPNASKKGKK
jgi:CRISPR system Cascade subunit CasA